MKITVESTSMLVEFNGVQARVWEGHTDSGIKVHCFITRIAVDRHDQHACAQFEKELIEQRPPSPSIADVYPMRMIL